MEANTGEITEEQWRRILEMGPKISVSPSQKVFHLILIHRAYYTPKNLYGYGRRTDAKCPRCQETGDLIHMMWRCPKLFRYWEGVLYIINGIFGTSQGQEVKLCVLGYREKLGEGQSVTVAILRCLFQARKLIALKWQSRKPPAVSKWINTINETELKEKLTYIKRGNLREFEKMWRVWQVRS